MTMDFRKLVENILDEENAATRHFRGNDFHDAYGQASEISTEAMKIYQEINEFLDKYSEFKTEPEYNTNSQTARIYKSIENLKKDVSQSINDDAFDHMYDISDEDVDAKFRLGKYGK